VVGTEHKRGQKKRKPGQQTGDPKNDERWSEKRGAVGRKAHRPVFDHRNDADQQQKKCRRKKQHPPVGNGKTAGQKRATARSENEEASGQKTDKNGEVKTRLLEQNAEGLLCLFASSDISARSPRRRHFRPSPAAFFGRK